MNVSSGSQKEESEVTLAQLRKDKETMLRQIEEEEEYLTNTLQKKLSQLRQEKEDLAKDIECEQEFITNRLQQEVLALQRQKESLKDQLVQESGVQLHPEFWKNWEDCQNERAKVHKLKEEMTVLEKNREASLKASAAAKKEVAAMKEELDAYKAENAKLKNEKFILQQKLLRAEEKYLALKEETREAAAENEIEDELQFNLSMTRDSSERRLASSMDASFLASSIAAAQLKRPASMKLSSPGAPSAMQPFSFPEGGVRPRADSATERPGQVRLPSADDGDGPPIVHPVDERNLIKSGYLSKKRGEAYVQRYLQLYSTHELLLFEAVGTVGVTPNTTQGMLPCSFVNLKSAVRVGAVPGSEGLEFEIVTPTRTIRFLANDGNDARSWVSALSTIIEG